MQTTIPTRWPGHLLRCLVLFGALLHPARALGAGPLGDVEIFRDPWGIPHVFSPTDAGAFYGLGYATAQDRGFQMTYSLRIVQGRLSEIVGEVKQLNRNDTSVDHDRIVGAGE